MKSDSIPLNELLYTVSSHTDAIHIGAIQIDGSRMTLPR